MRALGFEPKKEEIKKLISEVERDESGNCYCCCQDHVCSLNLLHTLSNCRDPLSISIDNLYVHKYRLSMLSGRVCVPPSPPPPPRVRKCI